jgi:hypothetical protein
MCGQVFVRAFGLVWFGLGMTTHATASGPIALQGRACDTQARMWEPTVMDRLVRWISGTDVGSISALNAASVYNR